MNSREMKQEREVRPTRTFITVIANQGLTFKKDKDNNIVKDEHGNPVQVSMLQETKYESPENDVLSIDRKLRFPISAAINGYVKEGDKIKIIALMQENNDDVIRNFNYFIDEVGEILATKSNVLHFKEDRDFNLQEDIIKINAKSKLVAEQNNELFMEILQNIEDNEILHVCITYGLKPFPIILFAAVEYAYSIRDNVDMESMVYGQIDRNTKTASIHELSSLFYTHIALKRMAELKEPDPIGVMRLLREDKLDWDFEKKWLSRKW